MLAKQGWHVLVIWECELSKKNISCRLDQLVSTLRLLNI
jgi:G:T-mismatch repair DNA endonuclease (very short patch repair protein)